MNQHVSREVIHLLGLLMVLSSFYILAVMSSAVISLAFLRVVNRQQQQSLDHAFYVAINIPFHATMTATNMYLLVFYLHGFYFKRLPFVGIILRIIR